MRLWQRRQAKMPPRNVPPKEMKALKDLACDEDILILPADKGKATVVMNKADYDAKMLTMLRDENTYRPVKKDPTSSLERNMNSMLLSLKRSGRLPDGVYSYLRSSAGSTPQLYGLLKVHKQDVPLRPIVSFVSSPTYRLSRFLANLLAPVVGRSSSHVHNSKDFAEFISQQALRQDEVMVSFDVVSLFTCVPTDLAVKVARSRLEKDPALPERIELLVDDIVNLLTLCLNATFLEFRGKAYQQVHGTAMGSPVSVVIANLEMEDVEQRALATFHSPPRFWKRYVDDTFTVLPCNRVQEFLSHLNSIEACIQFTFEKETEDGKLPFLDVCLCRGSDRSITTAVYRKPTHTNQYLPFDSHHPAAHKASVVRTLMSKASDLSSNGVVRVAEEERVVDALKQNGYPLRFIQKHSHCRNLPRPVEDDQRPPRTSLTLPYISGLSETIRRNLGPLDIRVAFRPHSTLRHQLVHPKDPVPMDQRTGVVYQIPCSECPKVYVGQTGRTLKHQLLPSFSVYSSSSYFCILYFIICSATLHAMNIVIQVGAPLSVCV